jgi:hypothetical protein
VGQSAPSTVTIPARALGQGHNDVTIAAVNNADLMVTYSTGASGDCATASRTCNPAGLSAVVSATYSK